jgi:hypothetical protein
MMDNLYLIITNPELFSTALLCTVLGAVSFIAALELTNIKGIGIMSLKYMLAFINIEAISNLFMIVLAPDEFLKYHATFNTFQITMVILLSWILFYEASILMKSPFRNKIKQLLKEIFSKK